MESKTQRVCMPCLSPSRLPYTLQQFVKQFWVKWGQPSIMGVEEEWEGGELQESL